ncbi:unnamed protein product [Eruca vesicaria subsp. sativa]|uniref:Uncharacterized protein n=1 Tax=Eruca vesicaria subsp. sativa TaxID=29727 RepID=A0ABC8JJF1_ERUVS|nr:unnamed protein product [Eruca vesicaria subsp. sativa]
MKRFQNLPDQLKLVISKTLSTCRRHLQDFHLQEQLNKDSLLIAKVQRRKAELHEQFQRKHHDVEAEHTAKNSERTSSFRLFSDPFQLELEKRQKQ